LICKVLSLIARFSVGLGHLKTLPALQSISFRRTGFTDADSQAFAESPKLTMLQAGQCRITKAGLEKIREELPGVPIGY
jgi:hypothetical protein